MSLTTQEQISDLQTKLDRVREELKAEKKEKNDALLLAEKSVKAQADAESRADKNSETAKSETEKATKYADALEDAETRASKAEVIAKEAVSAAEEFEAELDQQRFLNENLTKKNEDLEVKVERLESIIESNQPKLDVIAGLSSVLS